jgi:hypothetical protein
MYKMEVPLAIHELITEKDIEIKFIYDNKILRTYLLALIF